MGHDGGFAVRLVNQVTIERGFEDAGRQRVYRDAVLDPLGAERARQHGHRPLARAVGRRFVQAQERADRGDVDNAAVILLLHHPPHHLAGVPGPVQVEVEDAVPVLVGELERWGALSRAGGVDEDVDPAPILPHRVNDALDVRAVDDIAG